MKPISPHRFPLLLLLLFSITQISLAGTNEWSGGGPEGGQLYDLERDFSTANQYFAGTGNGVFKTSDGGASWTRVADGANRTIEDIAIADDGVMYALDRSPDGALFKSTDAGATWAELTAPSASMVRVAVAPAQSARVVVTSSSGGTDDIFLSTDGGASFVLAETGLPDEKDQVAFDPVDSQVAYCATDVGVYRSTDGGASWHPRNTGALDAVRNIAVSRSDSTILLAGGNSRVMVSSDAGATWVTTTAAAGSDGVWIAPSDSSAMLAHGGGGNFLSLSTDGGASWALTSPPADGFHIRTAAFGASTASTVLAGSSVLGVRKSIDSGATWSDSSTGINASSQWNWSAKSTASTAYDWSGFFKTTDSGASWTPIYAGLPSRVASAFEVNATDPEHGVWIDSEAMFETVDGGASWQDITPAPFFLPVFNAISIDPSNPQRWVLSNFFFDFGGVVDPALAISLNGGASWQGTLQVDPAVWSRFAAFSIKFSPDDPDVILASGGGRLQDDSDHCWIRRSSDGGTTWLETLSRPVVNTCFSDLRIDPVDPQNVYVWMLASGFRELHRSSDNGLTWSLLSSPSSQSVPVAVNPINGELYSGGDALYRSTDHGATWQLFPTRGLSDEVRSVTWVDVSATNPPTLWISTNAGTYSYTGFAEVFTDGFESGDTSAWSTTVP